MVLTQSEQAYKHKLTFWLIHIQTSKPTERNMCTPFQHLFKWNRDITGSRKWLHTAFVPFYVGISTHQHVNARSITHTHMQRYGYVYCTYKRTQIVSTVSIANRYRDSFGKHRAYHRPLTLTLPSFERASDRPTERMRLVCVCVCEIGER